MSSKLTTDEFIVKASLVHANRYDYSCSIYTGSHEKIQIICKVHGLFLQTANDHLTGHGCVKCNREITTSEFISRALKNHGNRYDYSKSVYVKSIEKIEIICSHHGSFFQSPHSHLKGRGCPKCRYTPPNCSRTKSTDKFVEEANKTHEDTYDYRKSKYTGAKNKLIIICKKHGEFLQTPIGHIHNKHGCPKCNSSRGEIVIRRWLVKNNIKHEEQKTFDECISPVSNWKLRFDFYIVEKNILVEYDGEQHFKKTYLGKHCKTTDDLKKYQLNDLAKNNFSGRFGIGLIRIPYFRFGEIESILKEKIL